MDKRKILIIDDEEDFARLVKLNLESIGPYAVKIETDPSAAIDSALNFLPDLIFIDVVMPQMEGPDVYAHLRNHVEFKDTIVIFLTATVTKEEVAAQEGIIGGHLFFAKPGSIEELVDCIEKSIMTPRFRLDAT